MLISQDMLLEGAQRGFDFKRDAAKYGYDTSFKELSFSKGNRNYTRILKRLEEINFPDPTLFNYESLSLEELKQLLQEIMIKILGPSYSSQIEYLQTLLYPTKIPVFFDSMLEEEETKIGFVPVRIHINRKLSTIHVASTGHEYIHALLSKYNGKEYNRVLSNIHYKELLSILIEYIIVRELSERLKDNTIIEGHSIIRAHHDKENAIEHKGVTDLSHLLRQRQLDPQTMYLLKMYMEYEPHNSFGYIISDIYSRRLVNFYEEDPEQLLKKIRDIIEGTQSINTMLRHYEISLTNIPTIENFHSSLERIKK